MKKERGKKAKRKRRKREKETRALLTFKPSLPKNSAKHLNLYEIKKRVQIRKEESTSFVEHEAHLVASTLFSDSIRLLSL